MACTSASLSHSSNAKSKALGSLAASVEREPALVRFFARKVEPTAAVIDLLLQRLENLGYVFVCEVVIRAVGKIPDQLY
jgi:hypothetical protein